ncbi:Lrp/AsnC family transcriptional regulator [Rhodococcus sp. IC4_135]|uniref:Lrp/AsnC family transcriptional regulator n=1 Tax=Rhodococcus TaxID=1827 RepID=UPI000BB35B6E|nr:Lrp/AsnC family transcriptional regulator [Rhodococcus erythropolis]NHP16980.1 Lrp/AsnC family transcriptional regulator [Rhodococcus sp. IC4_135]PBI97122.1 Regulatory protein AsnC [Rhodococcus erythropolis]
MFELEHGEGEIALDEQDLAIISGLQEDGRRSYGQLAKTVGLSETAVRRRTQRLIDSGVIRIVAVSDTAYLRKTVGATVGVFCDDDATAVIEALDAMPEVDYIVSTAGKYRLLFEAQCKSNDELFQLTNRVLSVPGVSGLETHYYIKYHKQTYTWPPGVERRNVQDQVNEPEATI